MTLIISYLLKAEYVIFILLTILLPALFLLLKLPPSIRKKCLVFSLCMSLPFVIVFDYLAIYNNAWMIPHSILSQRLLGVVPIEDVILGFSLLLLITAYFESFIAKKQRANFTGTFKYLVLLDLFLLVSLIVIINFNDFYLRIPYFYLWAGLAYTSPAVLIGLSDPKNFARTFLLSFAYFCPLILVFELIGLSSGYWIFSGKEYFGTTLLFGKLIPFEEILFWIILIAPATSIYYEATIFI